MQREIGRVSPPFCGRKSLVISNFAPGRARTCNPVIRSHILYPIELRVRFWDADRVKDATIAGNRKDVETAEEPICVSMFRR